jgi:hypothetical protein
MESLTSIKYKLTDYYNEKDPSILKNEKKEREILKNLNLLTRFSLDANSKHDKLLSKAYDLKNQQSQA